MPEIRSKWTKKVYNMFLLFLNESKPMEKRMEALNNLQPYLAIDELGLNYYINRI